MSNVTPTPARSVHWMGNFTLSTSSNDLVSPINNRISAARGLLQFVSNTLRDNPPENFSPHEVEMAIGGIDLLLAEAAALIPEGK